MYPNQRSVTRPRLSMWRVAEVVKVLLGSPREQESEREREKERGLCWIVFLHLCVTLSEALDTQVSTE